MNPSDKTKTRAEEMQNELQKSIDEVAKRMNKTEYSYESIVTAYLLCKIADLQEQVEGLTRELNTVKL